VGGGCAPPRKSEPRPERWERCVAALERRDPLGPSSGSAGTSPDADTPAPVLARALLAAAPALRLLLSLLTGRTARELATELMARAEEKRAATASAPPLCCVCM
jgi:hypothetical protein